MKSGSSSGNKRFPVPDLTESERNELEQLIEINKNIPDYQIYQRICDLDARQVDYWKRKINNRRAGGGGVTKV